MDLVQTARKIIALESTPATGNEALARFLLEVCLQRGLDVELHEESWDGLTQLNLASRSSSRSSGQTSGGPKLLLQSHLDTADPGPFAHWEKTGSNPFDAHVIDGQIYGLGAADAKIDFLCKIEALSRVQESRRAGVLLLGTFGEETGMMGALRFIRKHPKLPPFALVGEATGLRLVTAAKGIAAVEIRIPFEKEEMRSRHEHNMAENTSTQSKIFRGKAAHSSRPLDGTSAVHKLLDYLLLLPEDINLMEVDGGQNFNTIASHAFLEFDVGAVTAEPISKKINSIYRSILNLQELFPQFQDSDFDPPQPTLNIGMMRTHEDHILLSGSCRIPPSVQQSDYENWMAQLRDVCVQNRSDFRIIDYKRPFRTLEDSALVKICQEALDQMKLPQELLTQPLTNEASLFSRLGVECVCFGPGEVASLHTPFEKVDLLALEKAIQFYQNVIEMVLERKTE